MDAEAYLDSLAPRGIRLGLQRTHTLLAALGRPERGLRTIHVVGTNGKSSTARFCAAALATTGRRVGTYLSPAIGGPAQAVQLDGHGLSQAQLGAVVDRVRDAAAAVEELHGEPPTRFEALTAAALLALYAAGVDVAVVEAGLGGRLDATNVLAARLVGLTNVSLDHAPLLGATAEQIAAEKLGVVTPGALVLVGEVDDALWPAVAELAHARGALGVRRLAPQAVEAMRGTVRGRAAAANAALAVALARVFVEGEGLDPDAVRGALAAAALPGRLQLVPGEPPLLADGAHNPAGMRELVAELDGLLGARRPRVAVVGLQADKPAEELLALLAPHVDALVASESGEPGAVPAAALARAAAAAGLAAEEAPALHAVERAIARAGPGGAVLVTGSLYLLDRLVRAARLPSPVAVGSR